MIKKRLSPYLIIILSFLFVIIIGAVILYLPISRNKDFPFSFIDAIFMSTSSVCVTGLISVANLSETFTTFGIIIIALLVEIGGLGFVTITIFVFSILGLKIGISDRFLIKESLNQNSLKGMVKLVIFIIKTTFIIQLIGTIINFIFISQYYPFWTSLGISIFHSISSFNNAGFEIFPQGMASIILTNNPLLIINSSILIILGGIGFIVIDDLIKYRKYRKLTIHTKIVLKVTLMILIFGTILFKLFESDMSWLLSFFTVVAARTMGLQIIDFNLLSSAAFLLIIAVMYIGASPSSTGGGIKTTTFYTIFKSITAFATGKKPITNNREISTQSILKAFVIVVFSIVFIFLVVFLILLIEANNTNFNNNQILATQVTFDVVSAFSTTGFSTGIIPKLSDASTLLLVISMFFGRVGIITIISVWNNRFTVNKNEIKYLEERIIVG